MIGAVGHISAAVPFGKKSPQFCHTVTHAALVVQRSTPLKEDTTMTVLTLTMVIVITRIIIGQGGGV